MSFESLGLGSALLRAIGDEGYTTPTPVQLAAIPAVLAGRDVLACAQTGTGKTAAFTLPILERLHKAGGGNKQRKVRCLVLTPTRELAMQVCESVRTYGRRLPLKSSVVFGGVKIGPQIDHLARGADIVVATPGRLLDHISQRTVDLSAVEILVLDEADRMLDMGFINDMRRIIKLLPAKRQTLLFSATLSPDIRRLAEGVQTDPVRVDIAPEKPTAENISQSVYHVATEDKRAVLSRLIHDGSWRQVLVFTRTKHRANRVARHLEDDGHASAAIHGNKSQGARTRALADFKAGRTRVLVATDIAARGLDIDQLPCVVNFELPNVPEDYVHRIGRTGRAGMAGEALSLIAPDEHAYLRGIERLLGNRIAKVQLEGITGQARERNTAPARRAHGGDFAARSDTRPAHRGKPKSGSFKPRRRTA